MSFRASDITENKEYSHLLSLPYSDVVPFVFEYLKKRSAIIWFSLILALLNIVFLILFRTALTQEYTILDILPFSIGGIILFPLALIIPHELLHIIPYYIFGARDIRIGADFHQYYFYVSAHNFPVGPLRFVIIALTPLVAITAIIIALIFIISNPLWSWSLLLTLFVHLTMSAGDLALINLYWINRKKKIITWDDANEEVAYFYAKVKN